MRYLIGAVALALIFGAGTWTGWELHSAHIEEAALKQSHADLEALQKTVTEGVAKNQAQLQRQQDAALGLQGDQLKIHVDTNHLAEDINHATFHAAKHDTLQSTAPTAAGPDPFGSAEYVRLYNAAAKAGEGDHPAAAASSGVHEGGDGSVPAVSEPPSG